MTRNGTRSLPKYLSELHMAISSYTDSSNFEPPAVAAKMAQRPNSLFSHSTLLGLFGASLGLRYVVIVLLIQGAYLLLVLGDGDTSC